jgi:hypothetical protein
MIVIPINNPTLERECRRHMQRFPEQYAADMAQTGMFAPRLFGRR